MKVAIYVRNSTNEERQNPENQIRPLKKKCEDNEWTYEIFQEFASGAKESRTELGELMKRVRFGEFDIVMVWKLDRLGRSIKHLLQLIEEFKNKGVKFISMTEGFDTTTSQGELFFHIASAFAQYERVLIQERINAGLDRARSEGKKLGRPKGSKDKKVRTKGGYYLGWEKRKKKKIREKKTPLNNVINPPLNTTSKITGDYS